ncbi:MAG: hypothetical protein WC205_11660 [Opitutaceae bacterium]|jgi:hypothetical protein
MTEREQLIQLCTKLGTPSPAAAAIMADQLMKRCDQLMVQRGISRMEAMTYLLQLVTKGAQGEPPPGFEGVTKDR